MSRRLINGIGRVLAVGLVIGWATVAQDSALGAESLKPLLPVTPRPNYGAAVPANVSGRVASRAMGRSVGVEGVSVTDGYSVVKTDAQGRYTLKPNPAAVFVYITRPAGYDVTGHWYRPLAAKVDFALRPAAREEDNYTFIHVSDTHISAARRSVEGLSRFVEEVNALTPKPRFVVNSGDLVNLSKSLSTSPAAGRVCFDNYVGVMNHLSMPHYNVAGDHTDSSYRIEDFPRGDHRCGKPMYWEYLGPHFFSFEYGRIHFVSVDFGYHLGRRQIHGREYPTLEVQPMHTAWLNRDMAGRTKGTFVVTTAESDLGRHCPGFAQMAEEHDVRLQLTGDDHVVAHKSRPVPYRTGGALSGCWWNPKCQQLCPDLSPQGYLIYGVRGEEMDCFYKGLGQRVAIVSHRLGAPWKGTVAIRAHIVQPKPDETLQYSLGGTGWKEMKETARPFYRALFEATVDSTSLPDGLVELEVRSSQTGETLSRRFVVVNDSAAASQTGAMLTFTTGKRTNGTLQAPGGKVDVLFNDRVVGVLSPGTEKTYSFPIPAAALKKANTLRFRFHQPDDGMSIGGPVLTFQGKPLVDPRDAAIKNIKAAHWGPAAVDWGGFLVGDGSLEESPFLRRQNVFCFVVQSAE